MKYSLSLFAMMSFAAQVNAADVPVQFISMFDKELGIEEQLKKLPQLKNLGEEIHGTPVKLLVTYHDQGTAGGDVASFTSLMLAAGSLGILPIVENNDFVVSYELRVHSKSIASFSYSINTTEAKNMYTMDHKPSKEVLDFAKTTPALFAKDLATVSAFKDLQQEYSFYFPAN